MAPKIRTTIQKEATRDRRRNLGSLKSNLVTPATRVRYDKSLEYFFYYCDRIGFTLFTSITVIGACMVSYLETMWAEGDSISRAQDTVSALELEVADLKGSLKEPKRYLKCWRGLELPTKATPILRSMVRAMVAFALKQGQHRLALAITLGHVLCLRTGELLTLRFSDLTISPTCASLVAYLGKSKTGKRTNRSECARSTDKAINIFAKALRPDNDPGAYIINVSEQTFRK